MWARRRVDDLLEEIALGGNRPELQRRGLDLALAYNFATPYTAFLAIPASELDWQSAHALANARSYKAEILRRKPDAAHVAGRASSTESDTIAADWPQTNDSWSEQSAASRHERDLAANDSAESENPLDSPAPVRRMKLSHGSQNKSGEEQGGCASCAVGGRGDGTLAALAFAGVIMIAGLARRRRR